jgi:hypothetical protein
MQENKMKEQLEKELTIDDFFASLPPEEVWRYVQDIRQQETFEWNFMTYDSREPFSVGRFILAFGYVLTHVLTKDPNEVIVSPELIKTIHRYALNGVQKTFVTTPGKFRTGSNTIELFCKRTPNSNKINESTGNEKYKKWLQEMKDKQVPLKWRPGDEGLMYAQTLEKDFDIWLQNICDEYRNKIAEAKTDDEKLSAIENFLATLDRFHVFQDGNIRTVYILLNCLLINNGLLPTLLFDPNDFDNFSPETIINEIKDGIARTRELLSHLDDKEYKLFGHVSTEIFQKSDSPARQKTKEIVLLAGKWFQGLTQLVWKFRREKAEIIEEEKLKYTLDFLKNNDNALLMELSFADDLFSEALRTKSKAYLEAAIKLVFHSELPNDMVDKLIESCWGYIEKGIYDQQYYEVTSQWISLFSAEYEKELSKYFSSGDYKKASELVQYFRSDRDRKPYEDMFVASIQKDITEFLLLERSEKAFSALNIAKSYLAESSYLNVEKFFIEKLLDIRTLLVGKEKTVKEFVKIVAELLNSNKVSEEESNKFANLFYKKILEKKNQKLIGMDVFLESRLDIMEDKGDMESALDLLKNVKIFSQKYEDREYYEKFLIRINEKMYDLLNENKPQIVRKFFEELAKRSQKFIFPIPSRDDSLVPNPSKNLYHGVVWKQDKELLQKILKAHNTSSDTADSDFYSLMFFYINKKTYDRAEFVLDCIQDVRHQKFYPEIKEKLSYIQEIQKEIARLSGSGLWLLVRSHAVNQKISVLQDLLAEVVKNIVGGELTLNDIKKEFAFKESKEQFVPGEHRTNAEILSIWLVLDQTPQSSKLLQPK